MTGLTLDASLAAACRAHFGSGRAALVSMLGGIAEVSSTGAWVHASDGERYLDFGGYGVFILGHRHPAVTAAVHRQLDTHPLSSRVFLEPASVRAAAALAARTPPGLSMVHFVNSGAEATEAALKLARANGKADVITMANGFHGKTLGALSITAKDKYQQPFRPLLPGIREVPFGDGPALARELAAVAGSGCVVVEPVQGEAGVIIPPAGYLREVAALCRQHDALLVVDEIQTGLGRLGAWWGVDAENIEPDILLVGKGLSGGVVPISAMIASPQVYTPFGVDPYLHTSTFAGSPLACAAAHAALDAMEAEDIPRRAAALGATLLEGLRDIVVRAGVAATVRGRGLLIGIELYAPGAVGELFLNLIDRRVLTSHSLNSSTVLRLTPPATLTDNEVEMFLTAFAAALAETRT